MYGQVVQRRFGENILDEGVGAAVLMRAGTSFMVCQRVEGEIDRGHQ